MKTTGRIKVMVLEKHLNVLIDTEGRPLTAISHLFANSEIFDLCLLHDKRLALRQVLTFQPHVIVADYLHHEIDGGWLCEQARRLPGANPIIILTADLKTRKQEGAVSAKAQALGASAFLSRPLKQEDMISAIQNLMAARIDRGASACYTTDVQRAASTS